MQRPELIQSQVALSSYTSWLVGGVADFLAVPVSLEQLSQCLQWAYDTKIPVTLLGGGSNVLVSDRGVRGLVVVLRKLAGLSEERGENRLRIEAWAGTTKSSLLKVFLKHRLAPALFLAGLPGDVGGGVVMNAGVSESVVPREFHEIVDWVEVLPMVPPYVAKRMMKHELSWSYRHSSGWQPGVVVRVGMSWPMEPDEAIAAAVRDANQLRLKKQPLSLPSCGSVFINGPGYKAGAVIDQCGLRGLTIGGAQVSPKHANFIVNVNAATASDIHQIIEKVRSTVHSQTGIELKTEVVYLGEW